MVKMMKALVRIQVASSQVMGPLTMVSSPPFFTVTLLPLAGILTLLDQQQTNKATIRPAHSPCTVLHPPSTQSHILTSPRFQGTSPNLTALSSRKEKLVSARKTSHEHNSKGSELPMATPAWHTSKCKIKTE